MALKTNKILFATALLCTVCAYTARSADVETNTAHMQAMDKITGRISEIDVPVNSVVKFGSFSIMVRQCITRTPEETPENTAFVDVVDDYNNQEPVNIFKGWMFSSSPALSAVEHPIYDVWLLECYDKDNSLTKRLSEDELKARDEIKMVRAEKESAEAQTPSVPDKADSKPNPELEAIIKATIKDGVTAPQEQKADIKAEIVEVIVTTPDADTETDIDAPQALIHIEQQTEQFSSAKQESETESETRDTSPVSEAATEYEDENGFVPDDEVFIGE